MSRLDDIITDFEIDFKLAVEADDFGLIDKCVTGLKEEVVNLFSDLIDIPELMDPDRPGSNLDVGARNGFRRELRQKLAEL